MHPISDPPPVPSQTNSELIAGRPDLARRSTFSGWTRGLQSTFGGGLPRFNLFSKITGRCGSETQRNTSVPVLLTGNLGGGDGDKQDLEPGLGGRRVLAISDAAPMQNSLSFFSSFKTRSHVATTRSLSTKNRTNERCTRAASLDTRFL